MLLLFNFFFMIVSGASVSFILTIYVYLERAVPSEVPCDGELL